MTQETKEQLSIVQEAIDDPNTSKEDKEVMLNLLIEIKDLLKELEKKEQ